MTRLSIVIPHWGTISQLENTLVSVLENRPDDCQVVVILRDLYGDPYELKDEVSFVCAPIGAEPVRCVNLGIDASDAPVVHVLTPGVEVLPGWAEAALRHFDDPDVAAVAPRVVAPDDSGSSAAVEYLPRGAVRPIPLDVLVQEHRASGSRRLAPDPRAAFYRRAALDRLGRFGVELGWPLAAVDLALALGTLGYRCVAEGLSCVRAGSEEEVLDGPFRQAMRAERLFWRWLSGRGAVLSLGGHLGELIWETGRQGPGLAMFAAAAGRVAGLLTAPVARRRRPGTADGDSATLRCAPSPHFVGQARGEESSLASCGAPTQRAPS